MADEREGLRARGAETGDLPLLALLLRRRKDAILAAWERLLGERRHQAHRLSEPLLRDHVPKFLDDLADAVARRGGARDLPQHEPVVHARARLEQGFDLTEVAQEYSILRLAIFEQLSGELSSVAPADVSYLNEGIDRAISVAVREHQQTSQNLWEALDRISEIGLLGKGVEEVLDRLVHVVAEVAEVDEVTILLREGKILRRRATYGLDAPFEIGYSLPIGAGFAGTIGATRQPLTLDSKSASRLVRSDLLRQLGTRELYGVPLLDGDELLGVAHIGSRSRNISERDKILFRAMASRATQVIAHALSAARERAGNAAVRAFATARGLDQAAENLLRLVGESFGWDIGSYWRLDEDGARLRHVQHWMADGGCCPSLLAASEGGSFAPGEGLPGRAWSSGEPEWISDIRRDGNFQRAGAALDDGLHSAIAFPLRTEERTVGVLELFSRARRSTVEEAVEMTRAVAGQLTGLLARLTAEEEVRRSEAQLSAILDIALDCIVSMDETGRVTAWNGAAERTFGFSRAEAVGQLVADLMIPPRLREQHRAGLDRYLATGESRVLGRRFESLGRRRDGTEFPVELAIHRMPLAGPPQFTGTIRDITDRVQAQAVLRDNAQFAETLLGIVSHDLRNPLAAITTAGELLEDEADEELAPVVRRLLSSAQRMQKMIAALLDLTRGRLGGGIPVSPEHIDLGDTVAHAVDELALAHPQRQVRFDTHGDTSGRWDPDRMVQVVSNLLSNALSYSPPDSPVSLELRGADESVTLEVHNSGEPIAPDLLPTLFDPFRRGDHGRPGRVEGGLGLGLYIVDQIVRAHGGSIEVHSSAGEGTRFSVRLPRGRA